MPNPQNLIPAKKGEIRNPKGKPKGTKSFKTIMRKFLENSKVDVNGTKGDGYMALAATLYKKATTKEDVIAIREILDRIEGKAVQKNEVGGIDGQPIAINLVKYEDDNDPT